MKISKEESAFFPIKSAEEFVDFFQFHIRQARDKETEPNLAFLSILLGCLEYQLTLTKGGDQQSSSAESDADSVAKQNAFSDEIKKESPSQESEELNTNPINSSDDFPELDYDIIEALYLKFSIIIKGLVDKSSTENTMRAGYATRELCKKVSDIMWNRLNPHYHKDKAHIQSLFSFLTGRQLDCFGLAFAVIAACQVLRYNDVHLVMSEDHAWVAHGDNSKEMTEITWHGKGTEDKRGLSVKETDTEKSWMYLNGNAIICDRMSEVSAMIVSINPAIDVHADSKVLHDLKHKLLRFMFDIGALNNYPMGLCVLAEFEESLNFHTMALKCVEEQYNGAHVFPYCSQGHFHFRQGQSKEAIQCWAKAAQVLSKYNYTREDEEVYKEIMEVAGELIPQAIRNDSSVCDDQDCFMDLIRFYDGICLWEEESPTPVLHSWWAKYFTQSLGRFSSEVRESFKTKEAADEDMEGDKTEESTEPKTPAANISSRKSQRHSARKESLEPLEDNSKAPTSKLGVKSVKMRGLEELLVCGKKINAHTVSLQLTAQSQVHFVKRRQNVSDYSFEYSGRIKRPKKFFE